MLYRRGRWSRRAEARLRNGIEQMMRLQLLTTGIAALALLAGCAADQPRAGDAALPPPGMMAETHAAPAGAPETEAHAKEAEAASTTDGHGLTVPEPHAPPALRAEAAPEAQSVMEEARRVAECAEAVEARAEYAPLRARSPDPAEMTFKHFADETVPDAGERDLIRRFVEAMEPCRPHFAADTTEARLIRLAFGNQEKLYAELAAGQLSWGQFNKRTHDLDVIAETEARRLAAR